mmetsp:Transcript_65010/g.167327  ORF Transcript_65010/g.167327 Transcript_65010/m.167327 type:complete len:294 (-) Transcript_65010:24-905(-)
MAVTASRPVALALGAIGALCALPAAFVGPAAPNTVGRLRASGAAAPQYVESAKVAGEGSSVLAACSVGSLLVAAGVAAARRGATVSRARGGGEELATESIPRPEDLLESAKFPAYMGSAGGYMSRATRERHAITWTAKEEAAFEMPTGGYAIMNKGENLCYFRKKEQCIALGKQLRKSKIENYKIYRLAKDGTVTFMHPADGVFPEKVNKGRVQVNGRPFTVCQNPQPGDLKWTKYHQKSYEADPLTTMFVKARLDAFQDRENLFALPQPNDWVSEEEWPEVSKKLYDELMSL